MVRPIDYTIGGANPAQALMQGIAGGMGIRANEQNMELARQQEERAQAQEARTAEMQPLRMQQMEQGLEAGQLGMDAQRQQMAQQQRQQQRQERFQQRLMELAQQGDQASFQDYAELNAEFPEFGSALNETWTGLDNARKQGVETRLGQVAAAITSGNTDLAKQLADEYAEAARNSGDEASAATAEAISQTIDVDPKAALASLGMTASALGFDWGKRLFGGAGDVKVQSSQMISGRVAVQQLSDGTVRVVDTTTGDVLEGEAARQAIEAAEQAGIQEQGGRAGARTRETLEAETEGASSASASEALGKAQVEFATNAYESASVIGGTLRNMDRAIDAIDSGARSGVIQRYLPDITQSSAELRNAMNSLGLDVVGSVTFGALSEGELNLAMDVAVPRGLSGPRLKAWLEERREAQERVRTALLEQAAFLANPRNSFQDWVERVQEQSGGSAPQDGSSGEAARLGIPADTSQADIDRFREIGRKVQRDGVSSLTDEERQFILDLRGRR